MDELVIGGEDAGNDGGGHLVDVEGLVAFKVEGGGDFLEFLGPGCGVAIDVEADAEDEVAGVIDVDSAFGEHAGDFFPVVNEVVRPFELDGEVECLVEVVTELGGDPGGEGLDEGGGKVGFEGEGDVGITEVIAIPGAAVAASALGLFAGDDDEGGGGLAGELAFGFAIGAIDFVKIDNGEFGVVMFEVGGEEVWMDGGRLGEKAVAAVADGFECETLASKVF